MWRVASLWPLKSAIIGVYDHPPPDGSGIDSIYVAPETATYDLFTREAFRAARAATRLNDWAHGLF